MVEEKTSDWDDRDAARNDGDGNNDDNHRDDIKDDSQDDSNNCDDSS